MDINKAFDSVWHQGLLFKLKQLNVPDYLVYIIRQFLEDRTLKIKINQSFSTPFHSHQGVPQGSPLSPTLYNLYCHDIFNQETIDNYILQYADDTALISHGGTVLEAVNALQRLTLKIEAWFKKWRLTQNPKKSQFIIFYHTPKALSPPIKLGNTHIKPKDNITYLGIQFDGKLSFKNHSNLVKRRVISRAKYFTSFQCEKQRKTFASLVNVYTPY